MMKDVGEKSFTLHDVVFISSGLNNPDLGIFTLLVYPNTMTLQEFVDNEIVNEDVVGNNIIVEEINPVTVSDGISDLSPRNEPSDHLVAVSRETFHYLELDSKVQTSYDVDKT